MVHGLEKFKEYFGAHVNQYVFIGGTACGILLNELGVPFRATKDMDIVLIVEALDVSFGQIFWKFIEDGGYRNREKSNNEKQFYRFSEPVEEDYPKMIELFSRLPCNLELKGSTGLTPIHIDDSIISLSAILLDDVYYDLLVNGKQIVDGYSVIAIETIILFKMKAWLDLRQRKEKGDQIDTKNLRKHKNDVFRLLANVLPSTRIGITPKIESDVKQFIELIRSEKPRLEDLGLKNASIDELIEIVENIYVPIQESLS